LALNPDHPAVANSLNNLARLYEFQDRYAEAEPLYNRSLSIRENALGPEHPDVATGLTDLAVFHGVQGRYAEAEQLYKRALSIHEKALGPGHPRVATSLNNLAGLYEYQGRYADAEPLYRRSVAIHEKLSRLYESRGRYAEAKPLYKRSLADRHEALIPDHGWVLRNGPLPIDGEHVVERSNARGRSRLSLTASTAATPRASARSRTATRRSSPIVGRYCVTALCRLLAGHVDERRDARGRSRLSLAASKAATPRASARSRTAIMPRLARASIISYRSTVWR
jgi:tetratricopeptide (TPR) repeat protein